MAIIDLADAAGEHNRFEKAPALAIFQTQVKGAGESLNQRFAEFVAVIGGAVAGLDLDIQGRGQAVGTGVAVLPFQRIVRYMEIGHAVAGSARHDKAAPASTLDVTNATAGPGFGPGKGGDPGREIVGLGGKQGMIADFSRLHGRGDAGLSGVQGLEGMALDHAGVIFEGDLAALGIGREGVGDHLEQGFFIFLAIDHLKAPEKTVAGVLGVGVVEIHDLDNGRVAVATFDKVAVVQFAVPLVHGDTGDVKQAVGPFADQVYLVDRFRHDPGFKGGERGGIDAFGHPVVAGLDKGL